MALDGCEVRYQAWQGDQWQWLYKAMVITHEVGSRVRSGPGSPLNGRVAVKE